MLVIKSWSMVLGGYHRPRFLRHALRDVERGHIPYGEAENLTKLATAEVIGTQVAAGLKYVVDGMLDWHDIFRPFVDSWRNVYPDGLLRYFDNNFFYRIPVFKEEPEPSRLVLAPRVKAFRDLVEPAEMKVIVPGPLTFISLSKNESDMKTEELMLSVARILNMELKEAVSAGATLVQVDEPILSDPYLASADIEILNDVLEELFKGVNARKVLAIYFGIPTPEVYKKVIETKVDILSIPIVENPKGSIDLVQKYGLGEKVPALGIVDSRNIYDDDFNKVLSLISEFVRNDNVEEVVFTTSSWLDLIPFRYSLRKTIILGEVGEEVSEKLNFEYENPLKVVR